MNLESGKALAFIKLCSKGGPKMFLEGCLGADRVPSVKDFLSEDPEEIEKAELFLEYLDDVSDSLKEMLRVRPRQTKLIPSPDGSKLEIKGQPKKESKKKPPAKKKAAKKKAAKKKA